MVAPVGQTSAHLPQPKQRSIEIKDQSHIDELIAKIESVVDVEDQKDKISALG